MLAIVFAARVNNVMHHWGVMRIKIRMERRGEPKPLPLKWP